MLLYNNRLSQIKWLYIIDISNKNTVTFVIQKLHVIEYLIFNEILTS